MRVHYILHAAFEKLGAIEDWIYHKGHSLLGSHVYAGDSLPLVNDFDFLIVMGGPQSATQLDKWPYLKDEIKLIGEAIKENKAVLGFCLGAQLIAESLGAKTMQSPNREIGVFPIDLLPDAS